MLITNKISHKSNKNIKLEIKNNYKYSIIKF